MERALCQIMGSKRRLNKSYISSSRSIYERARTGSKVPGTKHKSIM